MAKSQLKKMTKLWQQEVRKAEEKAKRDAEAEEATLKKAEEAKKISIAEDSSLPAAERTKISHLEAMRGKRVKVGIPKNTKIYRKCLKSKLLCTDFRYCIKCMKSGQKAQIIETF